MKEITCFEDCLNYVVHNGFVATVKHPGWIPAYQAALCCFCDKLLHGSGQSTWYQKEFVPFFVHYERKRDRILIWRKGSSNSRSFITVTSPLSTHTIIPFQK